VYFSSFGRSSDSGAAKSLATADSIIAFGLLAAEAALEGLRAKAFGLLAAEAALEGLTAKLLVVFAAEAAVEEMRATEALASQSEVVLAIPAEAAIEELRARGVLDAFFKELRLLFLAL